MLSREHKKNQVFHEIKDIFLDAFSLPTPNDEKPILEKLVNIVEKISDEDLDTNTKLLEWSKIKFHSKELEYISSVISLRQVDLATKMEDVKKVLENIFSLYTKLCYVNLLTQDVHRAIDWLKGDLQSTTISWSKLDLFLETTIYSR